MSARLATVIRLIGLPGSAMKPDISSLRNTVSRQWPSRVPGPPVFSTGTRRRPPRPRSVRYSAIAPAPANVGLDVPAPFSSPFWAHMVPMPSTWPISWVMTSLSVPSDSMRARSAVSNDIFPLAGRNADRPADAGRTWLGPACPRILPTPSIATPSARMRTSSMTSPSTSTDGRSPTITLAQRSAALVKARRWAALRPPRKRTSIMNGEVVAASSLARTASARAS